MTRGYFLNFEVFWPSLSLYTFCIYDLKKKRPYVYVWDENTAKCGSVEIYSCLNKWINEHVLNVEQYPRNLKIFADNCGGQNKNNNMCISMLIKVHTEKFDRI